MNYTQQCQRPGCSATFDGAAKDRYCSDACANAAKERREWLELFVLSDAPMDTRYQAELNEAIRELLASEKFWRERS